ncbi:MAG: dTMP kinase [Dictyoglomus sp. NZ13-RE01]|nr:MAG: dTMP kinase [Dictyoglomus sp. NZ13-RE01]
MMKNLFITLEGLDGCGKTTQAKLLKDYLEERGHIVYLTREPGGSKIGEKIRDILLDSNMKIHPWTEALLYLSARLENTLIIKERLKEGFTVICERYIDSTIAYQGYGRGLPIDELKRLNNLVTFGLKPHLTILLDIEPNIALQRKKNLDRIEKEGLEFYNKVRIGYLKIAEEEKDRVYIVKAEGETKEISKNIFQIISKIFNEV